MNLTKTKFNALGAAICAIALAALIPFAGGVTADVGGLATPEGCTDVSDGTGAVTFDCLQDGGLLRLHLGGSDYLRYEPDSDGDGVIDSESGGPGTPIDQPLNTTGCALVLGSPQLATLSAGPDGATLGQKKDSIGVRYDEGGGEPCAQANGASQTLTLTVGSAPAVVGKLVDWAEIDLERKFDAVVRAEFFAAGEPVGVLILGCNLDLSDCGPDSGDGDNFRLDTRTPPDGQASPGPFDTIVLSNDSSGPSNGAFSLEGGADGTTPGPYGVTLSNNKNDSLFHLVTVEQLTYEGTLGCAESNSSDSTDVPSELSSDTTSSVVRLQNKDGSQCVLLPYNLEASFDTDKGQQIVFFDIDPGDQAAEFLWTGTWDIETAVYPAAGVTKIDFLDGNGAQPLQWCQGTFNPEAPSIAEQLASVDPIPGVGACLVAQDIAVVESGLQITERVLLSRDPRMLR